MSRGSRYALYGIAGLAGIMVLLAVTAVIVLQTPWFHDKVRERIVYEVEKATGGEVDLRAFNFDWRTLTAEVRGFVIHGTEPADQAPLFSADTIRVTLKIVSVWKKNVDIESLLVRKPQAHIIVYEDGRTNVPKPKTPRSNRDRIQTILDLAIRRFNLEDGAVLLNVRRMPLNVRGENLKAQIFYDATGPKYNGDLSFRQLNVKPGELDNFPLDVDAKLALARNRVEIHSIHVAYKESSIDFKGIVQNFSAPVANIEYAAHIYLGEVAPALRVGIPNRGAVNLGGTIAVSGPSGYELKGRLKAAGLAFARRGLKLQNVSLDSNLIVMPDKVRLRDLTVRAAGGTVTGEAELQKFRDFRVDTNIRGFSIAELTQLQGARDVAWSGAISGPVKVTGTIRNGKVRDVRTSARFNIAPLEGSNPVEGAITADYDQRTGDIEFGGSHVSTRFSRVQFNGTLGKLLNVDFQSTNLNDIQPAIAMLSSGPPPQIPVRLDNGVARFQGTVSGPLKEPRATGHATLTRFVIRDRSFDSLDTEVIAEKTGVSVQDVRLQKQQIRVTGAGRIGLRNWKAGQNSPISGEFAVRAASVTALLSEARAKVPVTGGEVVAKVNLHGTVGSPEAKGRAQATRVVAYQQAVDRVQGTFRYANGLVEVDAAQIQAGPSVVQLSGAFQHPKDDWKTGRVRFDINKMNLNLGKLQAVQERRADVAGQIEGRIAGEISIAPTPAGHTVPNFRVGFLNGSLGLRNLSASGKPLGDFVLKANTSGSILNLALAGNVVGSKVTGTSEWRLEGNFPVRGSLQFARVNFANVMARLTRKQGEPLPFDGFAEGRVSFTGLTMKPDSFKAAVQVPVLEVKPAARVAGEPTVDELTLRNNGPLLFEVDSTGARIQRAQLVGEGTNFNATGAVAFNRKNPWNVRVQGNLNLAVIQNFREDLFAAGQVVLDATLRGPLYRPDVYGVLNLKNASLDLANFPNGINHANGVIFLYRDRATIDQLTAETGGGKVSASGFIGFGEVASYNLQAKAEQVRVRYPEGVSSTLNAALTFTGNSQRSTLGGDVTVTRVGFNPRTDLGSLLAKSAQPVETPRRPNRFLQGIQFDVHVQTAPQVQLVTKLTKDVQAEADLRLRGDPTRPVLLGRVLINQGQIVFFGNQYDINSGEITFVNPVKIEPVLNLDLQTRARGIDVTLKISGPITKLNVSYSSDPPLQFSEIVALLTTGRAPSSLPGSTGSRSDVSQSWEQAGASAIVSQAIASPIAGRLQRFFGVSRLKIDPQITGIAYNNAGARLTLEQNVSSNITFTYITNLTRAQAQAIQVEWDFTKNWSAVALREENGLFGIDFLYKKQFK